MGGLLYREGQARGLTGFTNRMILSEFPPYWAPPHDKLGGELHIMESVFVCTPPTIPGKLPYSFQFWLERLEQPLREASPRSYHSPQMVQTCRPNPNLYFSAQETWITESGVAIGLFIL